MFHLRVLQLPPSLLLGAPFLCPLPTCTPWASRHQASTVVLSQPFAEAPCPGLHTYFGIEPQIPTDISQVNLVSKERCRGEPVVGAAENWPASCPSQQGSYCFRWLKLVILMKQGIARRPKVPGVGENQFSSQILLCLNIGNPVNLTFCVTVYIGQNKIRV